MEQQPSILCHCTRRCLCPPASCACQCTPGAAWGGAPSTPSGRSPAGIEERVRTPLPQASSRHVRAQPQSGSFNNSSCPLRHRAGQGARSLVELCRSLHTHRMQKCSDSLRAAHLDFGHVVRHQHLALVSATAILKQGASRRWFSFLTVTYAWAGLLGSLNVPPEPGKLSQMARRFTFSMNAITSSCPALRAQCHGLHWSSRLALRQVPLPVGLAGSCGL